MIPKNNKGCNHKMQEKKYNMEMAALVVPPPSPVTTLKSTTL